MSERVRDRVGVRELRQHLSVYLDRVKRGEPLDVTEHGRVVARLEPLRPGSERTLSRLLADGLARPATIPIGELPPPQPMGGRPLSEVLADLRAEERA